MIKRKMKKKKFQKSIQKNINSQKIKRKMNIIIHNTGN